MTKHNKKIVMKAAAAVTSVLVTSGSLFCVPAMAEEVNPAPEVRVLGEKDADAVQAQIVNKTGKDIVSIRVEAYNPDYYPNGEVIRMQEALIEQGFLDDEADGLFGPNTQAAVDAFREDKGLSDNGEADEEMLTLLYGTYTDPDLLLDQEAITDGTAFMLAIPKKEKTDENEDSSLKSVVQEYGLEPVSIVYFQLADDENEYVLHTFNPETMKEAELYLEESIAYITYINENGETVSTKDAEQAIYDSEHPAPAPAEDYYDYSYDDYSNSMDWYDAGAYYEEPVYAPAGGAGDGCIEDGLFNP